MKINDFFKNEIAPKDDEGIIIFDFSCYFPYSNWEVLTFDFSLGEEKLKDKKINHRYPNHNYQTITRKYGRKLSKVGYPFVVKLDDQKQPMLLCVNVGLKGNCVTLIFPLLTSLTKENPVCALKMRYDFDNDRFYFETYERHEDGGSTPMFWYSNNEYMQNCTKEWGKEFSQVLQPPQRIEDSFTLLYSDIITPIALPLSDHLWIY